MADSFSPLLNLRLQQTGNNQNTWGDLLNSDAITPLENAVAGRASHAVTGGTLDLSAAPLVEQVHVFSGTLTADQIVVVPNLSKRFAVVNNTSGSFFLLLKIGSNTTCIPQGTWKDVITDGAGGLSRGDKSEVGEIKFFAGQSVPAGYFECDGSTPLRASTPDLFGAVGTTWGNGNGATTYTLPDLRTSGRYLRARNGSQTVGTYQSSQNLAHTHSGSSASTSLSLSISTGAAGGHSHTGTTSTESNFHTHPNGSATNTTGQLGTSSPVAWTGAANNSGPQDTLHTHSFTTSSVSDHTHSVSGAGSSASTSLSIASDGGTEIRPNSAVGMACIRY